MPAHMTVLYPFASAYALDESASDSPARVIADRPAFSFALPTLERWLDGVLVLTVDPREPFNALIADVCAAFSSYKPYGGQFTPEEVTPHCTVAVASTYPPGISDADERIFTAAEEDLALALPITCSASAVWLMADTPEGWLLLRTFSLGTDVPHRAP